MSNNESFESQTDTERSTHNEDIAEQLSVAQPYRSEPVADSDNEEDNMDEDDIPHLIIYLQTSIGTFSLFCTITNPIHRKRVNEGRSTAYGDTKITTHMNPLQLVFRYTLHIRTSFLVQPEHSYCTCMGLVTFLFTPHAEIYTSFYMIDFSHFFMHFRTTFIQHVHILTCTLVLAILANW
mgnify:CR=1 FL=1